MSVHVHGGKHLIEAVKQPIVDLINGIPHDTIVDPFLGSGTFVRADEVAKRAIVNALGVTHEEFLQVIETLPQESLQTSNQHAIDFLQRSSAKDDENALLVLDPPRPSSKHYQARWSAADAILMYAEALKWSGPVVIAGYSGDSPAFVGGGWQTLRPVIDTQTEITEDEQDRIGLFVTYRTNDDADVAFSYTPTVGINASAQRLGSALLYHSLNDDVLSEAVRYIARLDDIGENFYEELVDSVARGIAAQYMLDGGIDQ